MTDIRKLITRLKFKKKSKTLVILDILVNVLLMLKHDDLQNVV